MLWWWWRRRPTASFEEHIPRVYLVRKDEQRTPSCWLRPFASLETKASELFLKSFAQNFAFGLVCWLTKMESVGYFLPHEIVIFIILESWIRFSNNNINTTVLCNICSKRTNSSCTSLVPWILCVIIHRSRRAWW